MPEPIVEPVAPVIDPTAELTTLRQVHSEVLTKRQRDKARIAELEASTAELQTKLTTAETAARDAIINVPLRHMAEAISTVPSMFLDVFNKNFKVEVQPDGKLSVLTIDGKRLIDSKGKDVPFTREALVSYLCETEPLP